jgi:hypothetical protein
VAAVDPVVAVAAVVAEAVVVEGGNDESQSRHEL